MLLNHGKLKKRVTIIPLNKISTRVVSKDIVTRAKTEVGAENAHLSLSLVGYAPEVTAAMQYVFGSSFICGTMEQAKVVTFHDQIRTKSVTLDGDMFDPQGTLSGGAAPTTTPVLALLQVSARTRSRVVFVVTNPATMTSLTPLL